MRPLYFSLLFCISLTSYGFAVAAPGKGIPQILVIGDSLSAGFGIDQSISWVSLLQKKLKNSGYHYNVFNASISGETSSGGLTRLPKLLKQHPQIVIIELGANDGLRGLPIDNITKNLESMIKLSRSYDAKVLLLGMKLPPNYGPAYTTGFHDLYKTLADKHQINLVPFFLSGIASQRNLMQDDNLHPTAEAQPLILENIWPKLLPLIQTFSKQSPG